MRSITVALLFAAMTVAADADAVEKPVALKQAPGLDRVEAN